MWTKNLPKEEGWRWVRWKSRGRWRKAPAEVVILKDGATCLNIARHGFVAFHKGICPDKEREAFGFPDLQFWSEAIEVPD